MDDAIVEMTSTGTLAIAVFGAVFSMMQTKYSPVSRSFAVFLAAVAVNNLPDAFRPLFDAISPSLGSAVDVIVWPSNFCLGPLFWMYVVTLTSADQRRPAPLARHFLLPGLAVIVALLVLVSPSDLRTFFSSGQGEVDTAWAVTLMMCMGLLQLAVYPQIALYLVLIVRRLLHFRMRLRDVYASTEQHELRWIYLIGGLGAAFWLSTAILLIAAMDAADTDTPPAFIITASLAGFVLVAATVFWGLRQRPPLVPDTDDPGPSEPGAGQLAGKYEKSALSAEASQRLGRKLRAAMEVDHLHRDPNLSLWVLARHTGASSNYISQTLNAEIGESFFDFVNSYRVAEAKTLLTTTDKSVLTITYDVGFNARSSFYNAFKRIAGQTPSRYRKNMSQREGLDDAKT